MPRWTAGRISLLGDACHPMLPFLAQGANSAIEDGMVLANCLKAFGRDVPAALNFYEQSRHERTSRLVRGSAANTDLFHNPALADGKSFPPEQHAEWSRAARFRASPASCRNADGLSHVDGPAPHGHRSE